MTPTPKWRIRLARFLLVAILGFSAISKLLPAEYSYGLIGRFPSIRIAAALIELGIVCAVLSRRWQSHGILAGTLLMTGAVLYSIAELTTDLPACGCFGGWVRLSGAIRLGLASLALVLFTGSLSATQTGANGKV